MHTFFINTSDEDILSNKDILDIEEINRKLILLDCPLSQWGEEGKGFETCADKIGELIDNHHDISNNFNLALFVDLVAIPRYRVIFEKYGNSTESSVCLYALYSVISNYIKMTLIKRLKDFARDPVEVIVIFEENKNSKNVLNFNLEDNKALLIEQIGDLIGFPNESGLYDILSENFKELYSEGERIREIDDEAQKAAELGKIYISNEMLEQFIEKLNNASKDAVFKEQYGYFGDKLRYLLAGVTDNTDTKELRDNFLMSIYDDYKNGRYSLNDCFFTSFETNRRAAKKNLTVSLKRNLSIYFYLTACVRSDTFIEPADVNGNRIEVVEGGGATYYRAKDIAVINRAGWLKIKEYFAEKKRIYTRKLESTYKMRESYYSLGLAPKLYAFDNERFAIDGYGSSKSEDCISRIFDKETVPEFDYDGLEIVKKMEDKRDVPPSKYISTAEKLRNYHLSYLEALQIHIMKVLSGYARSDENNPPVLSKRIVNIDTNIIDEEATVCRYGKSDASEETNKMVVVEKNALNAYKTIQKEYFKFCASKEVFVSDITKQYDWLKERIQQINESLKRLKMIAGISLGILIASYIPYVLIGWNNITSDIGSFVVGLCSLAVPVALFGCVFAVCVIHQKRKIKKIWNEFWNKHLETLESNKASARHFDRLLATYIPALRYIYEYYLDVRFCRDCQQMGEAKLSHHIKMLKDRISQTEKILSALQLGDDSQTMTLSDTKYKIDYHMSYCKGENNIKLYSIIDDEAIKLIYGGDGV